MAVSFFRLSFVRQHFWTVTSLPIADWSKSDLICNVGKWCLHVFHAYYCILVPTETEIFHKFKMGIRFVSCKKCSSFSDLREKFQISEIYQIFWIKSKTGRIWYWIMYFLWLTIVTILFTLWPAKRFQLWKGMKSRTCSITGELRLLTLK